MVEFVHKYDVIQRKHRVRCLRMMKLRMKNLARRLIRVFREYKQRKLDKYNQLAKTDKKKKDEIEAQLRAKMEKE